MSCRSCGANLTLAERFCTACGTAVTHESRVEGRGPYLNGLLLLLAVILLFLMFLQGF